MKFIKRAEMQTSIFKNTRRWEREFREDKVKEWILTHYLMADQSAIPHDVVMQYLDILRRYLHAVDNATKLRYYLTLLSRGEEPRLLEELCMRIITYGCSMRKDSDITFFLARAEALAPTVFSFNAQMLYKRVNRWWHKPNHLFADELRYHQAFRAKSLAKWHAMTPAEQADWHAIEQAHLKDITKFAKMNQEEYPQEPNFHQLFLDLYYKYHQNSSPYMDEGMPSFASHGEWALALSYLCYDLTLNQIVLTQAEYQAIAQMRPAIADHPIEDEETDGYILFRMSDLLVEAPSAINHNGEQHDHETRN